MGKCGISDALAISILGPAILIPVIINLIADIYDIHKEKVDKFFRGDK